VTLSVIAGAAIATSERFFNYRVDEWTLRIGIRFAIEPKE
jgi:hypothetical protein